MMKKIYIGRVFQKHFQKRIKNNHRLHKRFLERYDLFIEDRGNWVLRDHALKGELFGFRAFSVTGDIRVVYKEIDNEIIFIDIGTHNQIYN